MKIEVSVGEIVDKLSILNIKKENVLDKTKLDNIIKEFDYLYPIVFDHLLIDQEDFYSLLNINKKLWEIEDEIRLLENSKKFDQEFIELARSVYITNDKRAEIKKYINLKYGSVFTEEKSYEKY
jgi:hypothetical protein